MSTAISIELSFESFYNISKLCLFDNTESYSTQKYWFSWNFNDKTYKSDEFIKHDNGPSKLKYTEIFDIGYKLTDNLIPKIILDHFPIRIFLCTNQYMLGIVNYNPFDFESIEKENITSSLPFQISEWIEIKPIDRSLLSLNYSNDEPASMKISLKINTVSSKDQDVNDDDYNNESFEIEDVIASDTYNQKEVHFNLDPKLDVHDHLIPNQHNELTKQERIKIEKDKAIKLLEQEEEEERKLRHYRLSIDMRSIGGLKRPAHVSLQYIYPYLGTSTPVRTHPIWIMANTETKIDNGAASFECALSREQLRTTLTSHPLKVTALTKSHLGNNILGELNVDLASVMYTEPHSYRCPLSNKSFKTMKEYNKHRQILLTLLAAGRVEQAPPKQPIVVKAIDTYLVFTTPSPESRLSCNNTHKTSSDGKVVANYIVPLAEGSKLRVVMILEDIGIVGLESVNCVKPGYKMHNGALYDMYGFNTGIPGTTSTSELHSRIHRSDVGDDVTEDALIESTIRNISTDPLERTDLTTLERSHLEKLKLDWEGWRRVVDNEWREAMFEKENLLKKKLEADTASKLVERAEDLKRAQIEAGKLEIRLRGSIEEIERQKTQLILKEEQMQLRLTQKTSELQLLQRRVRDEAKVLVQVELRRNDTLTQQINSMQQSYLLMEKRAKDAEHDFDHYRTQLRHSPESVLREETSRLRAQISEVRTEIERERRMRSETELEKEHFRSQMHRLALALKREREKSSTLARQELEELRLEFLAREERYVLDGDREELRNIRNDLASLKHTNIMSNINNNNSNHHINSCNKHINIPTKNYQYDESIIESKESTSSLLKPKSSNNNYNDDKILNEMEILSTCIDQIKQEMKSLLSTNMYNIDTDPVVIELQNNLIDAENKLAKYNMMINIPSSY